MTLEEGRKKLIETVQTKSLAYILGASVAFVHNFGDADEKRLAKAASDAFEAEAKKMMAERKVAK